jgi:hypothetical protein
MPRRVVSIPNFIVAALPHLGPAPPAAAEKLNSINLRAIYVALHKIMWRNRHSLTLLLFKNTLSVLGVNYCHRRALSAD